MAFGWLNRIDFSASGYEVKPIIIDNERKQWLNMDLMLYYTGTSRISAQVQEDTQKHLGDKEAYLKEMLDIVDEAEKILVERSTDMNEFGALLHRSWELKRLLSSKVSTGEIDEVYKQALKAGALGGKLLGAGGGGFLLLYVQKERQPVVRQALNKLLHVPFRFEGNGAEIIYYEPEEYKCD